MTINPQGKISINVNDGVYCAVKTIEQDKISVGSIVNGVCELTGEPIVVENCDIPLGTIWNFDYISNYKLEVWGGQGGSASGADGSAQALIYGGYGGYSTGELIISKDEKLYINVGGAASSTCATSGDSNCSGGYNGHCSGCSSCGTEHRTKK